MTLLIWRTAPRSTRIHWGSEKALDQRVAALPSMACPGCRAPDSEEEATAAMRGSGSSARQTLAAAVRAERAGDAERPESSGAARQAWKARAARPAAAGRAIDRNVRRSIGFPP